MVRAGDIGMYGRRLEGGHQALRHYEIVDTPAHVLLARTASVAPPRVCAARVGVLIAESVYEAFAEQTRHAAALLVGKASVAAVRLGVGEVYLVRKSASHSMR